MMSNRIKLAIFGLFSTLLLVNVVPSASNEEDDEFYQETVVLKTKLGSIRGHKEVIDSATSFYAFKGIRYAKSPTKEGRFKVSLEQYICLNFVNIIKLNGESNRHQKLKAHGLASAMHLRMVLCALSLV